MRKFIFLVLCTFISLTNFAQESSFNKGDNVINAGLGIGRTYGYTKTVLPPIAISYEKGIIDDLFGGSLGVGGYLGLSSYDNTYYNNYTSRFTYTMVGGIANFHYPLLERLDTYTGIFLGYAIVSSKFVRGDSYYSETESSSNFIGYSWWVGARYYLTNNFAVKAELGYGISYLNLGIALKF